MANVELIAKWSSLVYRYNAQMYTIPNVLYIDRNGNRIITAKSVIMLVVALQSGYVIFRIWLHLFKKYVNSSSHTHQHVDSDPYITKSSCSTQSGLKNLYWRRKKSLSFHRFLPLELFPYLDAHFPKMYHLLRNIWRHVISKNSQYM